MVVRYGRSAHRATYGRLDGSTYTKDYIQLSRKPEFIADLEAAFPALAGGAPSVPVEFKWPTGSGHGTIFKRSADRPHLAWETRGRAPAPWRMSKLPTTSSAETIRGETIRLDPSNGICFSVLVDRAFEGGFLNVEDDLAVTVNWAKIGADVELQRQLRGYDGMMLKAPKAHPPKVDYLRRRRRL